MAYRDYPTRMPSNADEREKFLKKVGLDHLLQVWQWFEVYHVNPYVPPYFAMDPEEYGEEGDEGGEGGSGVKIIDLENGLQIYDFGDYLATSAGTDENYGPLANGRLFRTVQQMMDILKERGAQEVAFGKDCVDAAKLYAWKEAVEANIKVIGYEPTQDDILRLEEVFGKLGFVAPRHEGPE